MLVRTAVDDDGILFVSVDDFVQTIVTDLEDTVPEDAVIRRSDVIQALRSYRFAVQDERAKMGQQDEPA